MTGPGTRLLVVAGESSSDLLCAALLRQMKRIREDLAFVGVGGERMRSEGVELVAHVKELAVVGLSEVLGKGPKIMSVYGEIKRIIRSGDVDGVILVDYPEFNLAVAGRAREAGIPVIYYVSPQVWAWRRGRTKKIARLVDLMLVLFEFEVGFYEGAGVPARFVGHPLLDTVQSSTDRESFLREVGVDASDRVLAILPGSRAKEVERHLGIFLEAASIVDSRIEQGQLRPVVALADTIDNQAVDRIIANHTSAICVRGRTYDVLNSAEAALVASGTATLEAAILGVPMVVGYRVSLTSYVMGRLMVSVDKISLPNIVAGHHGVPELIQHRLCLLYTSDAATN